MMMTTVTGIGLLFKTTGFESIQRRHKIEGVAVGIPCFPNTGNHRHMAFHAAAKGMDTVHGSVLRCVVTAFAQLIFKQPGFGTDGSQQIICIGIGINGRFSLVYTVTGGAGHANLGMFTLFPVKILLVAVFGFTTGQKYLDSWPLLLKTSSKWSRKLASPLCCW
jgi:hypothetical protein